MGFVDLVKAYNTANHDLLLCILKRYRALPKFVAAIQTIYTNNVCMLKIEKEIVEIPQSVGVQQGNNMAPVLFLFLMTAFAETLDIVWREQEISILSVMTASKDNMINRKICSHTLAMFTSKILSAYKILQCLYLDDGAFPFGMRERTSRKARNRYITTLAGSDWKCTSDEGCHSPKSSVSSLPYPSSFNTHSAMLWLIQQSKKPFVAHTPASIQSR
jgi:hypothetical protein